MTVEWNIQIVLATTVKSLPLSLFLFCNSIAHVFLVTTMKETGTLDICLSDEDICLRIKSVHVLGNIRKLCRFFMHCWGPNGGFPLNYARCQSAEWFFFQWFLFFQFSAYFQLIQDLLLPYISIQFTIKLHSFFRPIANLNISFDVSTLSYFFCSQVFFISFMFFYKTTRLLPHSNGINFVMNIENTKWFEIMSHVKASSKIPYS